MARKFDNVIYVICEHVEKCKYALNCPHGKPHEPIKSKKGQTKSIGKKGEIIHNHYIEVCTGETGHYCNSPPGAMPPMLRYRCVKIGSFRDFIKKGRLP